MDPPFDDDSSSKDSRKPRKRDRHEDPGRHRYKKSKKAHKKTKRKHKRRRRYDDASSSSSDSSSSDSSSDSESDEEASHHPQGSDRHSRRREKNRDRSPDNSRSRSSSMQNDSRTNIGATPHRRASLHPPGFVPPTPGAGVSPMFHSPLASVQQSHALNQSTNANTIRLTKTQDIARVNRATYEEFERLRMDIESVERQGVMTTNFYAHMSKGVLEAEAGSRSEAAIYRATYRGRFLQTLLVAMAGS